MRHFRIGWLLTFIITSLVSVAILPALAFAASEDKVVVYTPWQDAVMDRLAQAFYKETGVRVESINISTGEIYARLKAERAKPQADVWHSARALYLDQAREEGLIAPYNPPNAKYVLAKYTYPGESYIMGTTTYPLVIVYNEPLLKKMKLTPPQTYMNLLDPKWKGLIVMPDPAASGTGFTFISVILQLYRKSGETGAQSQAGWDYLKRFGKNVGQFTRSGSAPANLVATGEYPVGIVFYDRVYQAQNEGYPVQAVLPEPVYAEPSTTALVAGAPHPEAAKKFINFLLSREAQEIAKELGNYSVRADMDPPKGAKKLTDVHLFDDDYTWSAQYERQILDEFNRVVRGQ